MSLSRQFLKVHKSDETEATHASFLACGFPVSFEAFFALHYEHDVTLAADCSSLFSLILCTRSFSLVAAWISAKRYQDRGMDGRVMLV